jgi:transcriptional regulator with PAS, ATPase and Fis domain
MSPTDEPDLAERLGKAEQARADIRRIAASTQDATNAVARVLGREIGLS